jgi:GDP-mannose 6-dehydrogenase
MVTLVESLIGKGCDVRILDGNVSIARLVGANRRYIEEEIPHIASLMCTDASELLAHAEVVVVGSAGDEAEAVLAGLNPAQGLIDLTRAALRRHAEPERAEGVR